MGEIKKVFTELEELKEQNNKLEEKLQISTQTINILKDELLQFKIKRDQVKAYKHQYYKNRKIIDNKLSYIDNLINSNEDTAAMYQLDLLNMQFISAIGGKAYLQSEIYKRRQKIKRVIKKQSKKQKISIWQKLFLIIKGVK